MSVVMRRRILTCVRGNEEEDTYVCVAQEVHAGQDDDICHKSCQYIWHKFSRISALVNSLCKATDKD